MAFRYREQAANHRAVIRYQWAVIGLLIGALYGAGLGWHRAVAQQTFHVPPDLRSGAVVQKGAVPPATVYAFAHYIFQQLNRWPTDGASDYGNAIYRLSAYLTPRFRAELEADLDRRGRLGELLQRTRGVHEVLGAGYAERRVDVLGNATWVVWLDLQINEWVKGMQVKDTTVRYPLEVVHHDIDREQNPWGLALNGYAATPRRLTDEELAELGRRPAPERS